MMTTSTRVEDAVIAGLLERVEKATTGDRELDVDIAWALEPERYRAAYWNGRVGKPGTTLPHKLDGLGRVSVKSNCPAFTNSIDAALALVERMLPGWSVRIYSHPGAAYVDIYRLGEYIDLPSGAPVRNISSPYYEAVRINDRHVALAIVEALLRSLIQEQKDGAP